MPGWNRCSVCSTRTRAQANLRLMCHPYRANCSGAWLNAMSRTTGKQPSRRWQVSSTIEAGVQSKDLARHMSIFEIDEALELLMDSAVEEASANNGQLSEELQNALSTYVEAFGEKVDRIAHYLKA